MNNNKILILDIETSGFQNQSGCILEIGIVSLDLTNGNIEEVFDSLLLEDHFDEKHTEAPYGWIFSNSDLTPEEVFEAPTADLVLEDVQSIIDEYPLGCTAFNNKFDFGFLEDRGINFPNKLPCPMILSTNICKIPKKRGMGFKWPSVEEAFKFFFPEETYVEEHRGLDDSRHEAMIVYKLYEMGVFKVPEAYDSTEATLEHIATVGYHGEMVIRNLERRYDRHDQSKLHSPEKEVFDEFTPKLKNSTYGSDEYKGFLKSMGVALEHHYNHNDHHPEYYGGINNMSLLSLIEMLSDWKAATLRHADGDIMKSIEINQSRFGYSEVLKTILKNTVKELGWNL